MDRKHEVLDVRDNNLFLGFKFGMTQQELKSLKANLVKEGKLTIKKKNVFDNSFFVIDDAVPAIYGNIDDYFTIIQHDVLTQMKYNFVIPKDKALFDKLKKYSEADTVTQNDSVVIKEIDESLKAFEERVVKLFKLKYAKTDEFIMNVGYLNTFEYIWYNHGRKIYLEFANHKSIKEYPSLYLEDDGSIKFGGAVYTNLKLNHEVRQREKKEEEVKRKAEEAEKIKKLNL